jgi:hypothetical protein
MLPLLIIERSLKLVAEFTQIFPVVKNALGIGLTTIGLTIVSAQPFVKEITCIALNVTFAV